MQKTRGAMMKHFPLSGLVSKARANPSAPTDVLRTDGAMLEATQTPDGSLRKEFRLNGVQRHLFPVARSTSSAPDAVLDDRITGTLRIDARDL